MFLMINIEFNSSKIEICDILQNVDWPKHHSNASVIFINSEIYWSNICDLFNDS